MLVSVIVPSYNRANVLPRAVKSVLAQTYQDFEIIIIDDCSKDNTQEVVKNFNDPRIRYIRHETNKGGNAARNTGIKAANGEFVAFLDSDDEWLPTKFEKQMLRFNDPRVGLVYCGQKCFNENNGRVFEFFNQLREDIFYKMLVKNYVGSLSAVIVRFKNISQVGFMDEKLKSCQDWDLYIRLSQICQFGFVDEMLVNYYLGKKDPNRISNNRRSILIGHEAIEKKYYKEIQNLPRAYQLQHVESMLNIFVLTGDLGKVISVILLNSYRLKSLTLLLSGPRFIGKCIKRNITKDYGY